jgi:hypothetical protein
MYCIDIEEGRAVKVHIKIFDVFVLFPSKEFLQISFNIQLLETSLQKRERTKTKVARC